MADGQVEYEIRADSSKLDSDLAAAQRQIQAAANKAEKVVEEIGDAAEKTGEKVADSVETAAESTEQLGAEMEKTAKKSKSLGEQTEKTSTKIKESGTETKKTTEETEDYGNEAEKAAKKAKILAEQNEKVKSSFADLKTKMSEAGKTIGTIAGTATAALTSLGTSAIVTAVKAETAFAQIKTLLRDGTDEKAYYEKIKAASKNTGVNFGDFSESVYSAISASVDQNDAVAFAENAVKLAKGGFTTTATSVDVLTTAINAYGLAADDATHISDVLITAQNAGKTTVDELASSMGQTIPIANASGAAIEDLATQYAVLTKNGIATAEAGTGIKAMLSELNAASSNISGTLRELTGKSFSELQAEGKSTADILATLSDYAEQSGKKLSDLFGSVEAGSAALTLVKDGGADFNNILSQMQNSAGTTQKAYETMAGIMEERFNKLKNKFVLSLTDVGEELMPIAEKIVDYIDEHSDEIANTIADVGKAVGELMKTAGDVIEVLWENRDAVAAVVAALVTFKAAVAIGNVISATVTAVKSFKTAADMATTSQLALNAAGMANPFVLLASLAAGAIAAFITFSATADNCNDKMREMNDKANDLISTAKEYKDEADGLTKVKDKYDEIFKSTSDAATKADELRILQDQLIDQYGPQASGIDLVNGEYSEQLSLLSGLIDKNKELSIATAKTAIGEAEFAEKQGTEIDLKRSLFGLGDDSNFDWAVNNLTTYDPYATLQSGKITLSGTYKDKTADLEKYWHYLDDKGLSNSDLGKSVLEQWKTMQDNADNLDKWQSDYSALTTEPPANKSKLGSEEQANHYSDGQYKNSGSTSPTASTPDTTPQKSDADYAAAKKQLDYRRDMGEVSDTQYCSELGALRDTYLTEGSDLWQAANVTIHNLQTKKSGSSSGGTTTTTETPYSNAKKIADYKHSMEEYDDTAYRDELINLRDTHLTADTDEWRAANVEIHNLDKAIAAAVEKKSDKSTIGKNDKKGNTISITSYIPTVWDNAEESNSKLKKALGAQLVGNSDTGKFISGLEGVNADLSAGVTATAAAADATEATLSDVVKAVKELKASNDKIKCSLDLEVTARNLVIGKVAVADINEITRKNGETPLEGVNQ